MTYTIVEANDGYEEFRQRYERAVPNLPRDEIAAHSGSWADMVAWVSSIAPHGFLCYFRAEIDPVMGVAGHVVRGTQYLMGNHIVAEEMFRHDPTVLLRMPLRAFLWAPEDGPTTLAIDDPRRAFANHEHPEIDRLARHLDRRVRALLDHLGSAG